jgi:isomerase DpgB
MSAVAIELNNRTVVTTQIDGASGLSKELVARLEHALNEAEEIGPGTLMLIHLVGNEASADSFLWPGNTSTPIVNKWERILRRMERIGVITAMFAERFCGALAWELFPVSDIRLSGIDFVVRQAVPGGSIWPGMALYRLSRQIGEARARKLYLEGSQISAARALELDIIDQLVVDLAKGLDYIAHLLAYSPLDDFAVRRRLMQDSISTSFDDALGTHLAACDRALRTAAASDTAAADRTSLSV